MPDRFWTPWRMEYLQDERPKGACVFCDLAEAPRETYRRKLVLVVQRDAMVCLNRYPFAASHLLIVPRRHVPDVSDLPSEEYDSTMRLVRDAVARLQRATAADGVNIGINLGRAAGAGIPDHMHAHAVPRWVGDTNFMPVLADVRIMPEYLDQSFTRLAPFFADLPGQHPLEAE